MHIRQFIAGFSARSSAQLYFAHRVHCFSSLLLSDCCRLRSAVEVSNGLTMHIYVDYVRKRQRFFVHSSDDSTKFRTYLISGN
jgi:hypothetical protein